MSRRGSGVVLPTVGASVRHPLWPELGIGEVEVTTQISSQHLGAAAGRVRWSTGQVSTHNLSVLRKVDLG
jgi:hypothetical protein